MRMRFPRRLFGLCCLAIASGCVGHPPEEHDADIAAPDGLILKASYFSPGKPGPAILLIHQCNMDRHAWDALAVELTSIGVHVLTFDQRGFGDTGGKEDPRTTAGDADAAYAFLASKKDVEPTRTAAGGASCGVAISADLAVRNAQIKALVLLSGGVTSGSRAYIAATPALAIFGAAGEWDTKPVADIRDAVAASKNPRSMLKTYRGDEHGVTLFRKNADLQPAIAKWLKAQLLSDAEGPRR